MKKVILSLTLCLGLVGQVQNFPDRLTLGSPPPTGVTSVSATVVGAIGNMTSYYWVVAIFPVGRTVVSPPAIISNAPNILSVTNFVRVSWSLVVGATGYDVLKTTTPTLPSNCTCAVVANTGASTVNDVGGALVGYAVSTVPTAVARVYLDNASFSQPVLYGDTPYNSLIYANLPLAGQAKGLIYLVVDALASTNCGAGGGSNTPALCWSNGTNWFSIGGGSSYVNVMWSFGNQAPVVVGDAVVTPWIATGTWSVDTCWIAAHTLPTGQGLIIQVTDNGNNSFAVTLSNVGTVADTAVVSNPVASGAKGDVLEASLTQVGSAVPGQNVALQCRLAISAW
jgi:hypothetical protein